QITASDWDAMIPAKITAKVTDASEEGLTVSASVEGFALREAGDVPDTGKKDVGIYIGIIEKGRVGEYRTNTSAGAKEDFAYIAKPGTTSVQRTISVPASKLDRNKQYVAVTWLAHGML